MAVYPETWIEDGLLPVKTAAAGVEPDGDECPVTQGQPRHRAPGGPGDQKPRSREPVGRFHVAIHCCPREEILPYFKR